jgi:hypothetical protein
MCSFHRRRRDSALIPESNQIEKMKGRVVFTRLTRSTEVFAGL